MAMANAGDENLAEENSAQNLEKPWFTGRDVDILFYKINRRPLRGDPTLFVAPEDLLFHIKRVLASGQSGFSGRNPKRTWHVGNLKYHEKERTFTGNLGWARTKDALSQTWDPKKKEWESKVVAREDSAVTPIAFSENGEILGIIKHSSFTTQIVLSQILGQIFNKGEQSFDVPSTDWSIQPLGNEREFLSWIKNLDKLMSLSLTFQRPNPDSEKDYEEQFKRLDKLGAKSLTEKYAALDKDQGLNRVGLLKDPITQGFIKGAMKSYGHVTAKGFKDGSPVKYDQNDEVLRKTVSDVGSDWNDATQTVLTEIAEVNKKNSK